jgi:hypothetical protein
VIVGTPKAAAMRAGPVYHDVPAVVVAKSTTQNTPALFRPALHLHTGVREEEDERVTCV